MLVMILVTEQKYKKHISIFELHSSLLSEDNNFNFTSAHRLK